MTDVQSRLTTALADRYRVERELGAGGMATVYLAHDLRHERDVAIKVLHPDLGAALGAERFLSEIKVTAKLQHPHILPLLDSGAADGLLYYVMPYVRGETLRARLERERQLPVDEALRVAAEVAEALQAAHTLGIVHRDIKPENILLQDGHALVADFGIALAVQTAGGQRMTQTGLSLGTPQYMSPEQAMGEKTVDARTDLYALGALTYEMLTGDPPFTGSSVQAIVARILTERPASIRAVRDTVPEGVEAAVLTALAKLPADRFASAQKFAEALATPAPVPAPSAGGRAAGRRRPTAAAWGTALAGTAALAAWGWARPRPGGAEVPPVSAQFVVELPEGMAFDNIYAPLAITNDGRTLVFRGTVNGVAQAMRRDLDRLEVTPIPGTRGAGWFGVSPDDAWLLYAADNGARGAGQPYRVSLAGGQPTPITARGDELTWLGTDSLLLGPLELRVAAVGGSDSGRTAVRADAARGEVSMRWPKVLPDRRHVVYTSWGADGLAGARLAVADLRDGTSRLLDLAGATVLGAANGRLYWVTAAGEVMSVAFDVTSRVPRGAPRLHLRGVFIAPNVGSARAVLAPAGTLAYLVDDGQWSELVTFDRRGGGVRAVPLPDSVTVTSAQWSPNGRRIAAELVTTRGGFDVGVVDPATGALVRLTSDGQSRNPVWSPDGRTVYYVSARTGAGMIWRQPADGTGTPESLAAVGVGALLSPSRDGRWLAVLDGRALRGYDLAAGAMRDVATEAAWAEHLALSPDGRWVAYTTTEGGRRRVVARPFPGGGAPVPLTIEEGGEPVWSADGRTLFYLATREQLRSMSLAEGPALRVTARRDEVSGPWFALSAGSRQHYDVTPDGGRLLGLRRRYQKPRLVVITHWRQQVEAQLAREGGTP